MSLTEDIQRRWEELQKLQEQLALANAAAALRQQTGEQDKTPPPTPGSSPNLETEKWNVPPPDIANLDFKADFTPERAPPPAPETTITYKVEIAPSESPQAIQDKIDKVIHELAALVVADYLNKEKEVLVEVADRKAVRIDQELRIEGSTVEHVMEVATQQPLNLDGKTHLQDPNHADPTLVIAAAGAILSERYGKDVAESVTRGIEGAIEDAKTSYDLQKINVAYEVEKAKEAYEAAKEEIKDGIELQKINVAYEKEVIKEGVEKAKEAIKDTWEKAKDVVGTMVEALADPALLDKKKEQVAALEKKEAELQAHMVDQAKRWEREGKGDKEKADLMQKAEKAAQAIMDKMIADQAKELERMRQMEEAHRPRW